MKNELIGKDVVVEGRTGRVVDVSGGKYRLNWEGRDEWAWIPRENLKVKEGQEEKNMEVGLIGTEVTVEGRKGRFGAKIPREFRERRLEVDRRGEFN